MVGQNGQAVLKFGPLRKANHIQIVLDHGFVQDGGDFWKFVRVIKVHDAGLEWCCCCILLLFLGWILVQQLLLLLVSMKMSVSGADQVQNHHGVLAPVVARHDGIRSVQAHGLREGGQAAGEAVCHVRIAAIGIIGVRIVDINGGGTDISGGGRGYGLLESIVQGATVSIGLLAPRASRGERLIFQTMLLVSSWVCRSGVDMENGRGQFTPTALLLWRGIIWRGVCGGGRC